MPHEHEAVCDHKAKGESEGSKRAVKEVGKGKCSTEVAGMIGDGAPLKDDGE
jgi:hypothetical protein